MKKIVIVLLVLSFSNTRFVFAQKSVNGKKAVKKTELKKPEAIVVKPNPLVFTFGQQEVFQKEFERLLYKNKTNKNPFTEKEVREYLDLYINFKLKVKEATVLQLDTNPTFISELAGYRKQLATPYLTDKKVSEDLMKLAYERLKIELNAGHILITCNENASPSDTLSAYNKLLDLRKRALKGESFDSLASKFSDDPSAKKYGSKLGWFSAFTMVYPFENAAFQTNISEISLPIRTQFGYHIIRVNEKRNSRGEIKVGHIMIRTGPEASPEMIADAKAKIDSAYALNNRGESFESLAERFSQDDGSNKNKGEMNWIASLSGYPEEFKDICFGLKADEISKPFQTNFGFHMLKFIEKRPLGEYKDMLDVLKQKVNRDSRSESTKAAVVARVKKENNYKEFTATIHAFDSSLDSSFIKGTWTYNEEKISSNPIFSIANKTYTEKDFASYVKANQQPLDKASPIVIANKMFRQWADDKCMAYEESQLDSKYEDFRNVMQEYHDGILLFDLTDKRVWSKAVSDTTGLDKFYELNKGKYMWKERVKYSTYTCLNEKVKADAIKMFGKGKTQAEVLAKLNKKTAGTIWVKETKSEKNTDATTEKLWDKKGFVNIADTVAGAKFYWIDGIIVAENKTLKESKGLCTSDYQNYLEKEWILELRNKYPVNVNEEAVKNLYK